VVDTGATSTGAVGVKCFASSSVTLASSIVWVSRPGGTAVQGTCTTTSSIVGPSPFGGAMNVDPMFVNPAQADYHLGATSPARDAVSTGPATDFERDPRPRGVRFDLGADEAP
jgi:hypothetical protein